MLLKYLGNFNKLKICSLVFFLNLNCISYLYANTPPYSSIGVSISSNLYIVDGDTIHLKDRGEWKRVRLQGIDAPEKDQAFGKDSTQALAACIYKAKKIRVEWTKKDKYGRLLGKVLADGIDCNLSQIKQGYAWHYKFYQKDQADLDRQSYSDEEVASRKSQIGLWQDKCSTPPWDWRRNNILKCS